MEKVPLDNSSKIKTEASATGNKNVPASDWDEDSLPSGNRFFFWLSTCLIGLFGLILSLISQPLFYPELKLGDIAFHDLKAKQNIQIEDQAATERLRQKVRSSVVPVFKRNETSDQKFSDEINLELSKIKTLQSKTTENKKEPTSTFVPEYFETYIAEAVPPAQFDNYAKQLISRAKTANKALPRFAVEDNNFWLSSVEEFLPENWSDNLKKQSGLLICRLLHPNLIIDEDSTIKKIDQLNEAVQPIIRNIKHGDIMLRRGETVDTTNIQLLQEAGIKGQIHWHLIFILILSLVASTALFAVYLYTYKRQLLFSTTSLGLIFTTSIIAISLAFPLSKNFQYFIPLPALTLVLTIFFGRIVACFVTIPLFVLLTIEGTISITNVIALSAACFAVIVSYSKQRHNLVTTGMIIGFAQAIGFLAALTFEQSMPGIAALGKNVLLEFSGGIVSAIISIGSLPFLEHLFGLVTPFRLAELTDADQPLLRKLQEQAPGTYQHSLAVANLAEAGARAIKADAGLVRAGALYHDIGKAADAKYFIENQLGEKNPHDDLTPEQSRDKVLNHVTNGLAIAKKYRLPKAIKEFIPMHQGTSLMAYFYHKACVRDGIDNVDPNFYRYPGPKPHSKETAIVMLADVCQAVTHSMDNPSQEEVEQALGSVLENRWQDGQLNQSTLNYKELQLVKSAFVKVWRELHHFRPKYPTTTTGHMPVPPHLVPPHNSGSTK